MNSQEGFLAVSSENEIYQSRLTKLKSSYRKHKDKTNEWWWNSFGVTPEELEDVKREFS